jgi:acetyl-CoA synthetase
VSENTQLRWASIPKNPLALAVRPNLIDLEKARSNFSWEEVGRELYAGASSVNISELAVDRQAAGPLHDHIALRSLGRSGEVRDTTFAQLQDQINRFANVLRELGRGDRVFALAGRIPALYVSALGTLKNTSVFSPLFSAFGPERVRQRLERGERSFLLRPVSLPSGCSASLRSAWPKCLRACLRHETDGQVICQKPDDALGFSS